MRFVCIVPDTEGRMIFFLDLIFTLFRLPHRRRGKEETPDLRGRFRQYIVRAELISMPQGCCFFSGEVQSGENGVRQSGEL